MSTSTAKKSKWFGERCEDGCQICGAKFEHLPHNGLQFAHIISKGERSSDSSVNCLALCSNCEYSFDVEIKPAIFNALRTYNGGKVPDSWEHGEGRARPQEPEKPD